MRCHDFRFRLQICVQFSLSKHRASACLGYTENRSEISFAKVTANNDVTSGGFHGAFPFIGNWDSSDFTVTFFVRYKEIP